MTSIKRSWSLGLWYVRRGHHTALTCPVMAHCSAREAGMEEALPIKKKAKPPRPELRAVAFIEGTGEHAGKWLIRQRPQEGLLARMWELPHVEWNVEGWQFG